MNCTICNIEFEYLPRPRRIRRYCSWKCRKQHKKLNPFWETATYEQKIENLKKRYGKYVIKNEIGCWDWKGAKDAKGYGSIGFGQDKTISMHRASWLIHNGPIPKGMWVLHKCDVPSCSKITENESHLFLGDVKINNTDMALKGRHGQVGGDDHKWSKLTSQQVQEIQELLKMDSLSQRKIASKYNVSQNAIFSIKHKLTWKHITRED